jgi:hypothetical protein
VFAIDVLRCGRCGGRRKLVAQITWSGVVVAMLLALGLPIEAPVVHSTRGPPELF